MVTEIVELFFLALDQRETMVVMGLDPQKPVMKHNQDLIDHHKDKYPEHQLEFFRVVYWLFLLTKNPNCMELKPFKIQVEGKGKDKIYLTSFDQVKNPINRIRSAVHKAAESNRVDDLKKILNLYGSTIEITTDRYVGERAWVIATHGRIDCGIIKEIN